MLFHTLTFWIFFSVVASLYAMLRFRGQNVLLLAAGYVFYGWWDWRFLTLLAASTVVDFFVARRMASHTDPSRRKRWLLLSLAFNLLLLGTFKYLGFAAAQMGELASALGYSGPWWVPQIILPVGISFYTFQSLAYTIDVYRGKIEPEKSLFQYAVYVSFFPQLLAGPIERPSHLLGQVTNPRPRLNEQRFREGLYYVLLGLFRKVVIADNLGVIVDAVFSRPTSELSAWEVLGGVYAFAFQIYGDFCGYSTMAQGIARWLGFDLMDNFRQPYFASSPQDFWRRWHISLSTWLRDYLYISLGGNRGGAWKVCRNLMITMLLGGLWHGANWTFIVWGALHGGWLVLHRLLLARGKTSAGGGQPPADVETPKPASAVSRLVTLLKIVATFHGVCLTWLFFRAGSVEQAWGMLSRLWADWTFTPFASYSIAMVVVFTTPLLLYEAWVERRGRLLALTDVNWLWRGAAYAVVVLALVYFSPQRPSEFIYFQF